MRRWSEEVSCTEVFKRCGEEGKGRRSYSIARVQILFPPHLHICTFAQAVVAPQSLDFRASQAPPAQLDLPPERGPSTSTMSTMPPAWSCTSLSRIFGGLVPFMYYRILLIHSQWDTYCRFGICLPQPKYNNPPPSTQRRLTPLPGTCSTKEAYNT